MSVQRFIVLLLAACVLLIFALGWYLRGSSPAPQQAAEKAATIPVPSTPPSPPSATTPPETNAAVGHRLAGTVVGDEQYVIIEHPDGHNELYRPGQTIPGLGRLVEIGPDRASFDGDDGRVGLRLLPGSTPTVAPDTPEPTAEMAVNGAPTASPQPPGPSSPAP